MTNTNPNRFRRFTTFMFGNWASRIYLGLVLLTALFLVADAALSHGPDGSFAGIYLIAVTSPVSWVSLSLIDVGPSWLNLVAAIGGILAGALINTAIISALARAITRPGKAGRIHTP